MLSLKHSTVHVTQNSTIISAMLPTYFKTSLVTFFLESSQHTGEESQIFLSEFALIGCCGDFAVTSTKKIQITRTSCFNFQPFAEQTAQYYTTNTRVWKSNPLLSLAQRLETTSCRPDFQYHLRLETIYGNLVFTMTTF